ncbi:MAG TPA: phage tail tape measure protein [Lacipirellulaceae bacterium]|nr:phage tail tape measure protein [Lacipirellulaceae bacterium]
MASSSNIRAGAAYIELYAKDNRLVKGLNAASAKLKAFGAGITSIGTKLAGLGAAVTTPFLGAAKMFADMGDAIAKAAARTGVSVEALSELGFAAEQSGTDLATLETSLSKMQKFLVAAAQGSQQASDGLEMLGLSAADLSRLAPEDQLIRIADRLSQIENPALRTAAAMQIFGRSGTKLLPLMKDGARGINDLREQARDLGLTMSTEDAHAAEVLGDTVAALWTVLKRTAFTIGAALAPLLTEMAEIVTRVAKTTGDWIAANKALITTIFKVGAGIPFGGAALVALGATISGLGVALGGMATLITTAGAAVGALGTMLASLLSPIGLVIAGVGSLAAYIIYATGAGGEALAWLGDQFGVLKDTALAAWKGIGDAMAAGDLALAAKILWLTLKMEWQRGVNFLEARWLDFKGVFVNVWQNAVFGIARLMTDAWAGLQVAWIETIGVLSDAWTGFIGFLKKGWNHFAGFFKKVWARIKGLFGDTDADAEIARINAEVAEQDQAIAAKRDATIVERERARRQERDRIERDRAGAQGALDEMQSTEQAQREAKHRAALAASETELEKARREWQAALAGAAEKRAEVETQGPERLKRPTTELPTPEGLDALMTDARRKIDVVGSFNPLAARGLGANSLSERTAKATEQVAANTKALVREAQHGGLVFS